MPESTRDLFILGTLSRGAAHGHQIVGVVRLSNASAWIDLSEKHVYYVLRKLEKRGLVTTREERVGRRPPRRVHELTEAGRAELRRLLAHTEFREAIPTSPFDTVLAILAFTPELSDAEATEVVRGRRDALAAEIDSFPEDEGVNIEAIHGAMARAMYDRKRAVVRAELEWVEALLKELDDRGWQPFRVRQDVMELS